MFSIYSRRYGKYTKKVNGELVKGMSQLGSGHSTLSRCSTLVTYDWFERERRDQDKYHGHQYKLALTKQQYDQMKSLVSPMGR